MVRTGTTVKLDYDLKIPSYGTVDWLCATKRPLVSQKRIVALLYVKADLSYI